jgi:hypothetical protein
VLCAEDLGVVVRAWDRSSNLEPDAHPASSDSDEAGTEVVQVLPSETEFHALVRLGDSLSADDDLSLT